MTLRNITLLFTFFFVSHLFSQKSPGYTLIYNTNGTGANSARLIDTSGTTYKSWSGFASASGYSAYMLPGGYLLRATRATGVSFSGGPICGKVTKTDWSGALVWDYTYSTTNYVTHHDICPMPNGDVLMIAYERRTATETSAMGGNTAIEMWPDKIVQVHPTGATTGNVVWEWRAWDHMQQNVSAAKPNYFSTLVPEKLNINYKQAKDWLHMNGLDYNPELDQITVTSHFMNEIYVIDHSTTTAEAASASGGRAGKGGDILYRFGNPAAYGGTGAATINVCHDAHWIDEGPYRNYLAYFGNFGISTSQSSVDFVTVPLVANGFTYTKTGNQYGPSTYSKRYACNGVTTNEGGSQSFANGNLLYTVALSGNIYEVDSTGKQLGSWSAGGQLAKSKRYTPCELSGGLTATCFPYYYDLCGVPSSPITLSCTGNGTGTMSYSWTSYPAGFTSTTQNPTVTPTGPITYICEVTNGICKATNYIVVNIRTKPTVTAGNDTTIAPSQPVTLKAVGNNIVSYLWSTGATTQSIAVTPATTTIYKVVVTSAGGCKDSDEVIVNVVGGLLYATTSATPNAICAGTSTNLNAIGSGGSGSYTYSWTSNPAGFTSNLKSPIVSPTVNTQYTVVVNDGTNTASANCTVTVNPLPPAPVLTVSGNLFTSTFGAAYKWFRNGVLIPGAVTQNYSSNQAGIYTVTIVDANGCESAQSNSISFVGIKSSINISALKIYPNPANTLLHIDYSEEFSYRILDISGKVLLSDTAEVIDISALQNGIYFISILQDDVLLATRKFVVMK